LIVTVENKAIIKFAKSFNSTISGLYRLLIDNTITMDLTDD